MDVLANQTDLLLVFGPFLAEIFDISNLRKCLESIETKILFSPYTSELNSLIDVAVPVALIAEKGGSLTNVDGIIQDFIPVLPPSGESLPEWELLVNLGQELSVNSDYYRQFSSPRDIFRVMSEEIPFFEK